MKIDLDVLERKAQAADEERQQINADIEQFAALQATLGRSAAFVLPIDVTRRHRIRRAARARKAQRGWA